MSKIIFLFLAGVVFFSGCFGCFSETEPTLDVNEDFDERSLPNWVDECVESLNSSDKWERFCERNPQDCNAESVCIVGKTQDVEITD